MLQTINKRYSLSNVVFRIAFFLLLIFCVLVATLNAQISETKTVSAKTDLPIWQSYKGVTIGMPADEARAKLGDPKSTDQDGFFYVFSETETAQILLDGEKKVRTISVVFSAEHLNQPKFTDVFNKSVDSAARPDGSVYKLVRYPDAGYWVSYNRMAGDKAMVIVMIQKL